ncbi:hypothetical protein BC629DRAFT_871567 [Irpex lacteus]|nr:hypothetical protein BC629DRAFT_871567 [Irpex lacteus]
MSLNVVLIHPFIIVDASQDVFGEAEELAMQAPRRGASNNSSTTNLRQRPPPMTMPSTSTLPSPIRQDGSVEEIELHTPRGRDTFADP